MYYFGQSTKSSLFLVCVVFILISLCCISAESDEEIFKSRPKQKQANGKQFPNLSFALPGLNLIQSRSNIFAKSTVTRTVLSTVATITAASFRTCTTTSMGVSACAGRRRRDLSGENELDGSDSGKMKLEIEATPSIKLIIDKTEITDPASVAEILQERPIIANNFQLEDGKILEGETTTSNSQIIFERNDRLDGSTTILYPSQDAPATTSSSILNDNNNNNNNDGEDILADDNLTDATGSATTVETPYSDNIDTTLDSIRLDEQDGENDKARLNVGGQGGVVTVTSMIPITHVVQTAATGTSATLTVQYGGCLPPSVPVYGQQCTM